MALIPGQEYPTGTDPQSYNEFYPPKEDKISEKRDWDPLEVTVEEDT